MPSYRKKPSNSAARKSAPKKPLKKAAASKGAKVPAKKVAPKLRRAKMTARKAGVAGRARNVEKYEHSEKTRLNNPPVGLVTPETDPDQPKKIYTYDPHIDPQLNWAGKVEKSQLAVDTVSIHVHERIDPSTIMEAVRTKESHVVQPSLFAHPAENPPLREALDFYRHQHEWSNRLIAGDSALVMNSLLEKEGMAGQVQMVYFDPPYGIKYKSNFQPFVNNRSVGDSDKDSDLTQEPEMVKAFRDTWELGIHSYLAYVRDRLLLAREMLSDSGSCFVQIGDENLHLVRQVMDEVFGANNFVALITMQTKIPLRNKYLPGVCDYILWYGRRFEEGSLKFRPLFTEQSLKDAEQFSLVELSNKTIRAITDEERGDPEKLPEGARVFTSLDLASTGRTESCVFDFTWRGKTYSPTAGKSWKTNLEGMKRLQLADRLYATKNALRYKLYLQDYPVKALTNVWTDTVGVSGKIYVVQTDLKAIARCLLMSTDPGDLVFDMTCGSGTTAAAAEQWGRRWITCDTSRVALTLTKQRLMTATYNYYLLAHEEDGVDGGFLYSTVPHITMGSITNEEIAAPQELFDDPKRDTEKVRVTGPFTVEAVPAPMNAVFLANAGGEPDATIARSGATAREADWRAELFKTGVRGLGGKVIKFSMVEPLAGTQFLHAEAETVEDKPQRVVISFGPDYAPLEQRQVEGAWKEARDLDPRPSIVLFAAFQFDPEAAKDIDEMPDAVTKKTTFLKVQMNTDLLTGDLKKKKAANESFWLIGRPDVEVRAITSGENKGKHQVEVHGFDYYDVKSGEIVSGSASKIAMWMLDTDYDDRSLFPSQVFFPMAGEKDGWARLAKNLKAEIDEELIDAYFGTSSIPFDLGKHARVAVKIVDDRGVESMRVVKVK